ncbi:hypothetical protein CYMTET_32816, partial [Cymbomonas tetramitiformis]
TNFMYTGEKDVKVANRWVQMMSQYNFTSISLRDDNRSLLEVNISVQVSFPETVPKFARSEANAITFWQKVALNLSDCKDALSANTTATRAFSRTEACTGVFPIDYFRVGLERSTIQYDVEVWDESMQLAEDTLDFGFVNGQSDVTATQNYLSLLMMFLFGSSTAHWMQRAVRAWGWQARKWPTLAQWFAVYTSLLTVMMLPMVLPDLPSAAMVNCCAVVGLRSLGLASYLTFWGMLCSAVNFKIRMTPTAAATSRGSGATDAARCGEHRDGADGKTVEKELVHEMLDYAPFTFRFYLFHTFMWLGTAGAFFMCYFWLFDSFRWQSGLPDMEVSVKDRMIHGTWNQLVANEEWWAFKGTGKILAMWPTLFPLSVMAVHGTYYAVAWLRSVRALRVLPYQLTRQRGGLKSDLLLFTLLHMVIKEALGSRSLTVQLTRTQGQEAGRERDCAYNRPSEKEALKLQCHFEFARGLECPCVPITVVSSNQGFGRGRRARDWEEAKKREVRGRVLLASGTGLEVAARRGKFAQTR